MTRWDYSDLDIHFSKLATKDGHYREEEITKSATATFLTFYLLDFCSYLFVIQASCQLSVASATEVQKCFFCFFAKISANTEQTFFLIYGWYATKV